MGRSEARITVDIWAEESDFTTLSADAQWMYFFLLSQPDLAHTGLLALRERRWSRAAAGLTVQQIETRLAELEQARYVVIDPSTEELLVRSFIRRDKVYRQPNVLRNAADQLHLIASPTLRIALAVELRRVSGEPMPDGSKAILAEMLEALPDPSEDPSDNPTRTTPGVRGVVTAVSSGFPEPRTPDPDPRAPSPGTPSASAARSSARDRRGTRIPEPFEPTTDMIEWARDNAASTSRADHAAFVDYWRAQPGAKGRKLDWPATWRNWMRREHERRTPNGRASPHRASTTDARVADALAVGEQVQAMLDRGEITDGPP